MPAHQDAGRAQRGLPTVQRADPFRVLVKPGPHLSAGQLGVQLTPRVFTPDELFLAMQQGWVIRPAVVTPTDAELLQVDRDRRRQRRVGVTIETRVAQVRNLLLGNRKLDHVGLLDGAREYTGAALI